MMAWPCWTGWDKKTVGILFVCLPSLSCVNREHYRENLPQSLLPSSVFCVCLSEQEFKHQQILAHLQLELDAALSFLQGWASLQESAISTQARRRAQLNAELTSNNFLLQMSAGECRGLYHEKHRPEICLSKTILTSRGATSFPWCFPEKPEELFVLSAGQNPYKLHMYFSFVPFSFSF